MRIRSSNRALFTAIVWSVAPSFIGNAFGDDAQSLKVQLGKVYRPSPNVQSGPMVRRGTPLIVQKEGLQGIPVGRPSVPLSSYKGGDGKVSEPGFGQQIFAPKNEWIPVPSGSRVYLVNSSVNVKASEVSFVVFQCETCESTDPSLIRAAVLFKFPKGFLPTADVKDVAKVVEEVFAIDMGGPPVAARTNEPPPTPMAEPPPPPLPPPAEPQAPPKTIEVGQTVEQVVAALGQPVKIVKLASKEMYFYKDLKITFVNGKVSDVE